MDSVSSIPGLVGGARLAVAKGSDAGVDRVPLTRCSLRLVMHDVGHVG